MFTTEKVTIPYPGITPNLIKHTIFYGKTGIGSTCIEDIENYFKREDFNSEYNTEYIKHGLYLYSLNEIHYYDVEYPIIRYESESSENINAFIKSINVSIVHRGAISYADENSIIKPFNTESVEYDVIIYITTPDGSNYIIDDRECISTISINPNLFLTDDGIIIAFYKRYAIATFDMKHSIDLFKMVNTLYPIYSVEKNKHGALYLVRDELEKYYIDFDINFSSPNIIECVNIGSDTQMKEEMKQHLEDLKKEPKIDFSSVRKRS